MTALWQEYLNHVSGPLSFDKRILCLFLIHNEAHLLPDLFAHYRAMGDMQFVVVDDRSTDETPDILAREPDVTVFAPQEGSTYAKDKRAWRGTLLDGLSEGRWCLSIDVDERLVWRGYPQRSLATLIDDMDRKGAQALIASMLDMYADRPIAEHIAGPDPLGETFDHYDDPRKDPFAYSSTVMPRRFREKFPLPNTMLMGGMRERLFGSYTAGPLARWLQRDALKQPRHLPAIRLPLAALAKKLSPPHGATPPMNQTKVPLVKWRTDLRYNGGAHHLSLPLPPASEYGVLLHYPITRGVEGINYTATRGQHAHGSAHYHTMGTSASLSDLNPVYSGTSRLTDFSALAPFFGDPNP
tara:strand:- start:819 stop:1883 length:1065 start_codon:yes stop_codon:yes gene_type:complete